MLLGKVMKIKALRLTFFVVSDHQIGRRLGGGGFRLIVRLLLALLLLLGLLGLFFLTRSLLLALGKGWTRVSGHARSSQLNQSDRRYYLPSYMHVRTREQPWARPDRRAGSGAGPPCSGTPRQCGTLGCDDQYRRRTYQARSVGLREARASFRRNSFTTETRRTRSFAFCGVFSVISVPPWLIFIPMGGPQTHVILRMTRGDFSNG